MDCKVFQIVNIDKKKPNLLESNLCDVYVRILSENKNTATCKIIYYKERPSLLANIYLGKRIQINKNLLAPTEVFTNYSHNVDKWLDRVKEFDKVDNFKEILKDVIPKTKVSAEIKEYILETLDFDDKIITADVKTKRVFITSKLIKIGRVFISKDHKIKVEKVLGNQVWYIIDGDILHIQRADIFALLKILNQGEYQIYPFWIDLMKDMQRILQPYLGVNLISWILKWTLDKLGVES